MARTRRRSTLLFATAALALAGHAAAADDVPDGGSPAPSEVQTISGTIVSVSPAEHVLTLDTDDGVVRLAFDRNTSVYVPGHLGTVRDLAAGDLVRASFGAAHRAYWIEIRSLARARADDGGSGAPQRSTTGPPVLPPQPGGGHPSPGAGAAKRADGGTPAS